MYATCLFCNKPLGSNETLESFPVGKRLAFDAAKGRLWVVCPHCERWNLTPLEERWEAIEQAEKLYRDTRLRVATDNIGLAKLRDGTTLVRIGEPLRPEFAAWRYGDQFGRRRRRQMLHRRRRRRGARRARDRAAWRRAWASADSAGCSRAPAAASSAAIPRAVVAKVRHRRGAVGPGSPPPLAETIAPRANDGRSRSTCDTRMAGDVRRPRSRAHRVDRRPGGESVRREQGGRRPSRGRNRTDGRRRRISRRGWRDTRRR